MSKRRSIALASTYVLAVTVAVNCGGPAVEVSTRVGPPAEQIANEGGDMPAEVDLDQAGGPPDRSSPDAEPTGSEPLADASAVSTPPGFVPQPPDTSAAFTAMVEALHDTPWDRIGVAARNLAQAAPSVWPNVREVLLRDRSASKSDYRTVLATIGGDVPDRYGHFKLAWKKSHGYAVRLSEDWFEDLLALPSDRIGHAMRPVYRDCVLQSALLRAAAHIARERPALAPEIINTLLDTAYVHHGTFRDEVGRAIVAVGDVGVPALVRATAQRDAEDEAVRRRAEYALFNLDRMEQREPRRALAQARTNLARYLELVAAYGVSLLPEAAPPLLELADDPISRVRETARAAFLAYVMGRAGTTETRTLRLLGGGTTTRSMLAAHRNVAASAVFETLAAAAPELVEPRCSLYLPSGVRDRTCEAQPERHARSYFAWLDARRRVHDDAELAAALGTDDPELAVQQLDQLLADGMRPPDVHPVVQVFVNQARVVRDRGDGPRAAQLLRKSSMLLRSEGEHRERAEALRRAALRLEAAAPSVTPNGQRMLLAAAGEPLDKVEPEPEHVPTPRSFFLVFAALAAILASAAVLGHTRATKYPVA